MLRVRINGALVEFESASDFRMAMGLDPLPETVSLGSIGEIGPSRDLTAIADGVWSAGDIGPFLERLSPAGSLVFMALAMSDEPLTGNELADGSAVHSNGIGSSVAKIARAAESMGLENPVRVQVSGASETTFDLVPEIRELVDDEILDALRPKFESRRRSVERVRAKKAKERSRTKTRGRIE